ncbi:MAG: AAA family ATPase [Oscillospiraceae bacterium]|nr:MAG: AAA family ATPase [Oscillospiraceae bacterium]
MHQALYRKWRPRNFDEVCGQEQVTSILKYECQTGHFSHAYLFCGSRGTGKTSCAKILAKAVNCEHPTAAGPCGECAACRSIDSGAATDVLEMDAASNNGVEAIRDIRDEVIYTPSELKYRVYIVDEVHMLSASAFNALLKTWRSRRRTCCLSLPQPNCKNCQPPLSPAVSGSTSAASPPPTFLPIWQRLRRRRASRWSRRRHASSPGRRRAVCGTRSACWSCAPERAAPSRRSLSPRRLAQPGARVSGVWSRRWCGGTTTDCSPPWTIWCVPPATLRCSGRS